MKKSIQYLTVFFLSISLSACAQTDPIVGVWDVKNDYYQAVYELIELEGVIHGKVHYYNDGETEYEGEDREEDYFLTELKKEGSQYLVGKMYLPDGSYYEVIFTLKSKDELEAKMTVLGQPYVEKWTRNLSN